MDDDRDEALTWVLERLDGAEDRIVALEAAQEAAAKAQHVLKRHSGMEITVLQTVISFLTAHASAATFLAIQSHLRLMADNTGIFSDPKDADMAREVTEATLKALSDRRRAKP